MKSQSIDTRIEELAEMLFVNATTGMDKKFFIKRATRKYKDLLSELMEEVKIETQRKLAQKIYDKWNNQRDSVVDLGTWLKRYLLSKEQEQRLRLKKMMGGE